MPNSAELRFVGHVGYLVDGQALPFVSSPVREYHHGPADAVLSSDAREHFVASYGVVPSVRMSSTQWDTFARTGWQVEVRKLVAIGHKAELGHRSVMLPVCEFARQLGAG